MSDQPTEEEFRAAGFTAAAINYPLSDAAVAWLCKFNGAPDGWVPPRAWRYAPNPTMQAMLERNAAAQSGVTLSDVPLSTGTGQGKAPEISGGLGTVPQQTCEICKGQGLTGWEKPMGNPPQMVFVPQLCQCEAGKELARVNAPDAKRTIISSIPGFEE